MSADNIFFIHLSCCFVLFLSSNTFKLIHKCMCSFHFPALVVVWYLRYTSNSTQDIVVCVLCLTSLIWWSLLHIYYKHSAYLWFWLSAPQFDHSSHNPPTSFRTSSLPLQHFVLILSDIASFRLFLIILLEGCFLGWNPVCIYVMYLYKNDSFPTLSLLFSYIAVDFMNSPLIVALVLWNQKLNLRKTDILFFVVVIWNFFHSFKVSCDFWKINIAQAWMV